MPKDDYGSGHKYGQGHTADVDDYYDEEEEWDEEEEEWVEEQQEEVGGGAGGGKTAAAGDAADENHSDPNAAPPPPAAGSSLGAFIVTTKGGKTTKGAVVDGKSTPPPHQQQQQQQQQQPAITAEEKAELDRLRSDLESHGVPHNKLPKAAATLRALHKTIVGEGAQIAAKQRVVMARQGKLIEEAPEELWDIIMCFLNFHGIVSLASTCEWLRYVATSASCLPVAFSGFRINVACKLRKVVDPTIQKKLSAEKKPSYRTQCIFREAFFFEGVSTVSIELPKNKKKKAIQIGFDPLAGEADNDVKPSPLEFPWNFFDSMRYEAIRQQRLAWDYKQDHFDRDEIDWHTYSRTVYDPKLGRTVTKNYKTDKNPSETPKKREVLKTQFELCDTTMAQVKATAWIDAFRGLLFDSSISKSINEAAEAEEQQQVTSTQDDAAPAATASKAEDNNDDEEEEEEEEFYLDRYTLAEEKEKRNSALWWYCAVMANWAAGMPNVALEYLNDAVEAFTDDDYQESKKQEEDEKAEEKKKKKKNLPKWFVILKRSEERIREEDEADPNHFKPTARNGTDDEEDDNDDGGGGVPAIFSKLVPWEMPDATTPIAKTIGVPQPTLATTAKPETINPDEVSTTTLFCGATNELLYGAEAWRMLESRVTQASFDSLAAREHDVTLVEGPVIAKRRDIKDKETLEFDEEQSQRQDRRQEWLTGRRTAGQGLQNERSRYEAMTPSQRRLYKQCHFGAVPSSGKKK